MYIISNCYTNENIGEFNSINIFPQVFQSDVDAKNFAKSLFDEDVRNGCKHDTIPANIENSSFSCETKVVYIVGETEKYSVNSYQNIYAVIEIG